MKKGINIKINIQKKHLWYLTGLILLVIGVGLIPLEQLLTETDAPYLSPVAGERNESVNVTVTIKKIAKIKGLSEDEVGDKIWENGVGLFEINVKDEGSCNGITLKAKKCSLGEL